MSDDVSSPSVGLALTVRFLLELASLVSLGYWGFRAADGVVGVVLAVSIPLAAALLWGAVVSPRAFVPAPPAGRLLAEAAVFGAATLALASVGRPLLASAFAVAAVGQRLALSRR